MPICSAREATSWPSVRICRSTSTRPRARPSRRCSSRATSSCTGVTSPPSSRTSPSCFTVCRQRWAPASSSHQVIGPPAVDLTRPEPGLSSGVPPGWPLVSVRPGPIARSQQTRSYAGRHVPARADTIPARADTVPARADTCLRGQTGSVREGRPRAEQVPGRGRSEADLSSGVPPGQHLLSVRLRRIAASQQTRSYGSRHVPYAEREGSAGEREGPGRRRRGTGAGGRGTDAGGTRYARRPRHRRGWPRYLRGPPRCLRGPGTVSGVRSGCERAVRAHGRGWSRAGDGSYCRRGDPARRSTSEQGHPAELGWPGRCRSAGPAAAARPRTNADREWPTGARPAAAQAGSWLPPAREARAPRAGARARETRVPTATQKRTRGPKTRGPKVRAREPRPGWRAGRRKTGGPGAPASVSAALLRRARADRRRGGERSTRLSPRRFGDVVEGAHGAVQHGQQVGLD